jgi:hypothetical protein
MNGRGLDRRMTPNNLSPVPKPRARVFSMKCAELLAQSNIFKIEIALRTEKGTEKQEKVGEI